METSAVMRPQEMALWWVYSPYYTKSLQTSGIPHIGGEILGYAAFTKAHPHLRIKRRTRDVDPYAVEKTVSSIRLYKQNDLPFRFEKENITIYISEDNSFYKPYVGDFSLMETIEIASNDVYLSRTNPYASELLTAAGTPIRVLTLGNLHIDERYIAVGIKGASSDSPENRFFNVPVHAISIFDINGNKICATPGNLRTGTALRDSFLDAGFNFDDGFGAFIGEWFDPHGDSEG